MSSAVMSPPAEGGMDADIKVEPETKPALTPPSSEGTNKNIDDSGSELSDLEPEAPPEVPPPAAEAPKKDDSEIFPDHYYGGGNIPVFKPTMDQFRSFKDFVLKIDKYGMKSGIVKVIPPAEWRENLPALDEQVKTIRVKNPISQEFHGSHGTYTQANMEKQRTYNLPQWKSLCEESNHQPPAKRGERRRNQERPTRTASTRTRNTSASPAPRQTDSIPPQKRRPGRPPRAKKKPTISKDSNGEAAEGDAQDTHVQVPPTPTSPVPKIAKIKKEDASDDEDAKPKGRQPKSVTSRRKYNKQSQADVVDEESFKDFDYRVYNQNEWTKERVQELETAYWKSLTFNNPMYGADMPGSLFDDSTKEWNVAKLENLLDVLGQKVPGVNTAYLYLGMWKATFAWHLEDVDLYSINYIHFGAPKQWYSISQADARRFERAMQAVWPTDAKNCDQFLRHKTYLISPQLLQSQYNIRVNRLVHNEGEFVITFPYGYHSGFNLGYNCAESVNFATDSWLEYGRIARKCNCEADSVWIDVRDIERKLRGEPTPEYFEETEEEEDEEEEEEGPTDLPTPPGSVKGRPKKTQKRKREPNEKNAKPKIKKLRIKLKVSAHEPCTLCPNDSKFEELLPTDNGKKAHRRCGLYTPETYISAETGSEQIYNVANIDKARLDLRCQYCRSKKGSVFQCSAKKCTRAYHATCAPQAGVLVDIGLIPVFGEDGTEYTDTGIDFRCRFHRSKRGKNQDSASLEENAFIRKHALKMKPGDLVQAQFYQQEIFAGVVSANRKEEEMLVLETLPKGEVVEVEYKWLLILDPLDSLRPVPSENAKPMPAEMARTTRTTAEAPPNADDPKTDEPFCDSNTIYKWSEFNTCKTFRNSNQKKVDVSKAEQLWYYLGKTSTEAKAQYTHDPSIQTNNLKANFLESVRPPPVPLTVPAGRRPHPPSYPASGINQNAINAARANSASKPKGSAGKQRPYQGKYAITDPITSYQYKPTNKFNPDGFQPRLQTNPSPFQYLQYSQYGTYSTPSFNRNEPLAQHAQKLPNSQNHSSDYFQMHDNYSGTRYYNYSRGPPNHKLPALQTQIPNGSTQAPIADMSGQAPATERANSRPGSSAEAVEPPLPEVRPSNDASQGLSDHSSKPSVSTDSSAIINSPDVPEIKGISHLNIPEKYFYLHEAEKKRPKVYQSPYAAQGGFTEAWLPLPDAARKLRPRGPSISEDYLAKQKPSHQEEVARKMSEEKVRLQQENHQRVQRRLSQTQSRPHLQNYYPQHPPYGHHPKPQHLPLSVIQDPNPQNPGHPSHASSQYFDVSRPTNAPSYDQFSPTHFTGPPPSSLQQTNHFPPTEHVKAQTSPSFYPPQSFSSATTARPEGLQFASPQDFRMQMESAASHQAHAHSNDHGGYQSFWQGLQNATGRSASAGHQPVSDLHIVDGGTDVVAGGGSSGSPLKYEMSGGGETLPMMRDGSRY